jgi:exopolysaccharide biosynthesis polyprenyl glycosylphosphotransferase
MGPVAVSVQESFSVAEFVAQRATVPAAIRVLPHAPIKRMLDIAVAFSALAVLLPVLVLVAIAIKLDTKGPVLFRQRRIGLGGKAFDIFKFRSMDVMQNGDDVVQALPGDPRVTRVGRFLRSTSLDELPQFLNVLGGEMTLVGPRPHAIAHDALYSRLIDIYPLRHLVKPGLTGWAQIHGFRGPTPSIDLMRRRVELDIWYARHANFALDLKIMLRTPQELLCPRNAC